MGLMRERVNIILIFCTSLDVNLVISLFGLDEEGTWCALKPGWHFTPGWASFIESLVGESHILPGLSTSP